MVQYQEALDRSFGALSDPTRRAILLRLGRGNASISELSERFPMTLTGLQKHIVILEQAGLVSTTKVGRVRECRLGPRKLDELSKWIANYQQMLAERLDSLDDFLERTKGTP